MKQEYIDSLTREQLLSEDVFDSILAEPDQYDRDKLEEALYIRAQQFKVGGSFRKLLKGYKIKKINMRCGVVKGSKTKFTDQPLELYCGDWICDMTGVYKNIIDNRSGSTVIKYASPLPILITEYLQNVDTELNKVKLAYFRDGWKSIVVNASTIASNTKIIELADYGIIVNSSTAKLLIEYLGELISLNEEIIPKLDAVSSMGWVDDEFVPFNDSYRFDGQEDFGNIFKSVHSKGDYSKWIEFVKNLRENKMLRLVVDASFASVLLKRLKVLPFIVHLWGGTGAGKTVAQIVAASVWGNPVNGGMWRSLNNTLNYCMSVAGFFKDIPVIFDELQTIKNYENNYDKLIMTLTEGIDRGRMTYNKANKTSSWNCCFIFSGEETIAKDYSGGGTKNRVIEIECTEKLIKNGRETVDFMRNNYGFAGEEFVKTVKLVKDAYLTARYAEYHKRIIETCDTTEKQAMAMAALLVADEIVADSMFGETPLDVEDVKNFLVTNADVDVTERAWEFLTNLISINANNFDLLTNGEKWGTIDKNIVLINKNILVQKLHEQGFDFDACKRKWSENGRLVKNSQGKFSHQTHIDGLRATYIKLNIDGNLQKATEKPPF